MSFLARLHACGLAIIAACAALPRLGLGLLLIGACGWAWRAGLNTPGLTLILGAVAVWGLVKIVTALGVLIGAPSPERNVRRETRKALRRAGMLRRW